MDGWLEVVVGFGEFWSRAVVEEGCSLEVLVEWSDG